jgi:cytoskeleton protein RodZ
MVRTLGNSMVQRRGNLFGDDLDRGDDRVGGGVGALLQRRREELQQDIEDISHALRIRPAYVLAIEEGRFQELPGNAYAIGFVRAYADYIGLDGASIVADYREELARRSRQNDLVWPSEGSESRFPGGAILVVCLLLGLVIYGGWYYATQSGGTGIKLIDQVPEYIKKATGVGQVASQGNPAPTNQATGKAAEQMPAQIPGQMPAPMNETTIGAPPTQPAPIPPSAASAAVPQPGSIGAAPSPNGATSAAQNPAPAAVAPTTPPPAVVATPSSNGPGGVILGQGEAPAAPAASGAPAANAPAADTPAADTPAADTPAADTPAASPTSTAPSTAPAPAASATDAPTVSAPNAPSADTGTAPAPAPAATSAQTAAVPPPAPAAKIVIRANRDSWIEIRDPKDNVLLQKVLRPGESYNVPDQKGLVMTTGNAGGIVIELDGRPLQSIGSLGVVKRGIKLDPVALANGSAFNSDDDQ